MNTEKYTNWIKENGATLMTIGGVIGMGVTTVLGIRAGMKTADILNDESKKGKAEKKEIAKTCAVPIVGFLISGGFVIGADILNRQQKSDLLAMVMAAGAFSSQYRQEVIKRYGEEVDADICNTVRKNSEVCAMYPEIPDELCHWYIDMCCDELPIFEMDAYERDIIHAELHLNRNYILSGEQSVRNFLEFLDKRDPDDRSYNETDMYGWAICDSEIYFIDFEHEKVGEKEFRLYPVFSPWREYDTLDMFGNPY